MLNSVGYAQTTPAARQLLDSMIQALGGSQFLGREGNSDVGPLLYLQDGNRFHQSDLFTDYIKFPDMERTEFG